MAKYLISIPESLASTFDAIVDNEGMKSVELISSGCGSAEYSVANEETGRYLKSLLLAAIGEEITVYSSVDL